MIVSSALATFIAAILAWLNERTDASIGMVGRVLPLIPFLMPAIALPLGWLFLASPRAGALNLLLRAGLDRIGIHLTDGPLDVYSWPGLIFLYTVFLCGFAYLVIASSMRTLDRGLEEAAKIAGAEAAPHPLPHHPPRAAPGDVRRVPHVPDRGGRDGVRADHDRARREHPGAVGAPGRPRRRPSRRRSTARRS